MRGGGVGLPLRGAAGGRGPVWLMLSQTVVHRAAAAGLVRAVAAAPRCYRWPVAVGSSTVPLHGLHCVAGVVRRATGHGN